MYFSGSCEKPDALNCQCSWELRPCVHRDPGTWSWTGTAQRRQRTTCHSGWDAFN